VPSALFLFARSFIAPRSSSVNPLDFLLIALVLLPGFMRISFHLFEAVCRKTPGGNRSIDIVEFQQL